VKTRFLLIAMISIVMFLLAGCGGGSGPGGIINPPEDYRIKVTVSAPQVVEGQEIECWAEISPSPPTGISITWRQDPASPSGQFLPPSGTQVEWKAPIGIQKATSFSIIAEFTLLTSGRTYQGSTSIVVLPQSSPPVSPPSIHVDYPSDEQIVGSGTLLTILGAVQAGTNPLKELEAIDSDGTILQRWSVSSSGVFRVDLSNFGSPGRKVLKVRVVDSADLFAEANVQVNNDDALLDQSAREFLKRYNVAPDGGSVRLGDLSNGAYTRPVMVYIREVSQWEDLIREACSWWKKYTGLEFELSTGQPTPPGIYIADETAKDEGSIVASTRCGFDQDPHQITTVTISLYKGWLNEDSNERANTVAHEMGHALLTTQEVEDFGPYMVMWPYGPRDQIILPPIVQKAVRMLYEHPPAWTP
jgi:hypothetical protein